MSVLVVGSVALDAVEAPSGAVDGVVGGSANYFASAASLFTGVRVVGVVGDDYPVDRLRFLVDRGVDLAGLVQLPGESFFWAGRYLDGFKARETLETRLGVFAAFDPVIPPAFRDSEAVFLGNIDPVLQLGVLDQVRAPRLVAADTMNFWIEGARDALLEVVSRIDLLFVNDEEAAQLSGHENLAEAARWIRDRGPGLVVVKRGERGATVFAADWSFSCPAHRVPAVIDPTGAGDAFAGGFLGYLDRVGSGVPARSHADLQRAVICGSAMGSYAVEAFSVDRFRHLDAGEVDERVAALAGAAREPTSLEPVHMSDSSTR